MEKRFFMEVKLSSSKHHSGRAVMVSPVFFGLRSVFLFAARHAGRGDAARLAQTAPLATVSRGMVVRFG